MRIYVYIIYTLEKQEREKEREIEKQRKNRDERGTRVGGCMKPCNEREKTARTTQELCDIELITHCTYISRISGLLY